MHYNAKAIVVMLLALSASLYEDRQNVKNMKNNAYREKAAG
jgi:hypothetical protein